MREAFDREHCVRIRGFLEPPLLEWLRARLRDAHFVERVHEKNPEAVDSVLQDRSLLTELFMLLNASALYRAAEGITGCDRVGVYYPVVYRISPGSAHGDDWHSDVNGRRILAMATNIGGGYDGGALQIRERHTGCMVHEVVNDGPGDAVLFRIDERLEHRVAPVGGTRPRLTMTGWFLRWPEAGADWPRVLAT